MNVGELFVFLVIIIFGTFSIEQDIRHRKVENTLNLFFFTISFIIFIFATPRLIWSDFLTLVMMVLLSYYLYKKDIWGGADGKIFISLSFLLITIQGYLTLVNYVINLIIFYAFSMIIISFLMTSIKNKKAVLKKIDYKKHMFLVLVVFTLTSTLFRFIPKSLNQDISNMILVATFISLLFILSKSKKFFDKFSENIKIVIIGTLFFILVFFSHEAFLKYFFPFLFLKVFIDYSSKITSKIKSKTGDYATPFTTYLFIVALFTVLLTQAVVVILVKFIAFHLDFFKIIL